MKIRELLASIVLAIALAGCGAADVVMNGLSYSKAVETDLEKTTGVKPDVGFNWRNGSFQTVTVTFPRLLAGRSLDELAGNLREIVTKEFKEAPDKIVLAFEFGK